MRHRRMLAEIESPEQPSRATIAPNRFASSSVADRRLSDLRREECIAIGHPELVIVAVSERTGRWT